ncbi:EpsG family protein [Vibrio cyclitrophicus]
MSIDKYQLFLFIYPLVFLILSQLSLDRVNFRFLLELLIYVNCFFMAVRDPAIGIDTVTYVKIFESLDFNLYPLTIDPLFEILIRTLHIFSNDGRFFLFVCYFIISFNIISSLKRIDRKGCYLAYSIFMVSFLYFNMNFNILRQAISISFLLQYISLLYVRCYKKSLICILIASFFHVSSVVLIGLFFLYKIKNTNKTIVLMIASIIFFFAFEPIVSISGALSPYHWTFDKLYRYTTWEYSNPFQFKVQYILTLFLFTGYFYFYRKKTSENFHRFIILGFLYGVVVVSLFSFDEMVADRIFYVFFFYNFLIVSRVYQDLIIRTPIMVYIFFLMMSAWCIKTVYIQFPVWFVYKTFLD